MRIQQFVVESRWLSLLWPRWTSPVVQSIGGLGMWMFLGKPDQNPQTLLFSATIPSWVQQTAQKYLQHDIVKIDLVGKGNMRTSTSVQVWIFITNDWPVFDAYADNLAINLQPCVFLILINNYVLFLPLRYLYVCVWNVIHIAVIIKPGSEVEDVLA